MHKVLLYGGLLFGVSAVLLGWSVVDYLLWLRRYRHLEANRDKGPVTFVCQDTEVMLLSVTGTYRPQGEWHLIVTDASGWPHVIDRRDIVEVYQ